MSLTPTKARICCALPAFGGEKPEWEIVGTLFCLAKQLDALTVDGPLEMLSPDPFGGHLVHARSELVHRFLRHPANYTHLLFWDTDIPVKPAVVAPLLTKMLRANKDILAVPYAQKVYHWEEWEERESAPHAPSGSDAIAGLPIEARLAAAKECAEGELVWYVPDFQAIPRGPIEETDCAEMVRVPLGFTLIKRQVLHKMTECYRSSLTYASKSTFEKGAPPEKVVALFMVELTDRYPDPYSGGWKMGDVALLGEDYAFIDRWTRIGGKCHIYLGPEAPLGHRGSQTFRGSNAAIRKLYLPEVKPR
jgi:hypothetical protein